MVNKWNQTYKITYAMIHLYKTLKGKKYSDRKQISESFGLWEGEGYWLKIDTKEFGEMREMCYILIFMEVTWLFTFVKTHQTVYFTMMHFIVCNLYLNKAGQNLLNSFEKKEQKD